MFNGQLTSYQPGVIVLRKSVNGLVHLLIKRIVTAITGASHVPVDVWKSFLVLFKLNMIQSIAANEEWLVISAKLTTSHSILWVYTKLSASTDPLHATVASKRLPLSWIGIICLLVLSL
jgi:hypothetical protein